MLNAEARQTHSAESSASFSRQAESDIANTPMTNPVKSGPADYCYSYPPYQEDA